MLGLMGAVALGLFACGGKVVIDAENGAGGAGGTGSSSNGSSSSSTGTGMGGGDPQSLCDKACEKMNGVPGCAQPDCAKLCFTEYQKAGMCQAVFLDLVTCVIDNAGVGGSCTGQPCDASSQTYQDCINGGTGGCSTGTCSGGPDGSCQCGGVCNGSEVSAACFTPPNGAPTCICSVGGKEIAKCDASGGGSGLPCDIVSGCCSIYF